MPLLTELLGVECSERGGGGGGTAAFLAEPRAFAFVDVGVLSVVSCRTPGGAGCLCLLVLLPAGLVLFGVPDDDSFAFGTWVLMDLCALTKHAATNSLAAGVRSAAVFGLPSSAPSFVLLSSSPVFPSHTCVWGFSPLFVD